MLVVFLGAPGSGKGTQAKIISSKYNLKHLSTGDMLREVAKSGTNLGNKISEIQASGSLVTDDMVNKIVEECLASPAYKNASILDGYPRTLAQAEFLANVSKDDYKVIYFKIDTKKLESRIEGRYICLDCGQIYNEENKPIKNAKCDKCDGSNFEHRADDNASSLRTRVSIFEEQISEILEFYNKKNKLCEVAADASIDSVTSQIDNYIKDQIKYSS